MSGARPKAIVIVDDDPLFARLLARALGGSIPPDVPILVASSPTEAMGLVERLDTLAVVVADHQLNAPWTGVDLLRWVHEREPGHHRILMTSPGNRPGPSIYPVALETFEKPSWLDIRHPLLSSIATRCGVPAPQAALSAGRSRDPGA